jgi:hypothetical protein
LTILGAKNRTEPDPETLAVELGDEVSIAESESSDNKMNATAAAEAAAVGDNELDDDRSSSRK